MEENPNRENIMKAWKDYTFEDAIVVIEKAIKATKPETINSCWRKLRPDVVCDFAGFTTKPVKEIMKQIVDMGWGRGGGGSEGFQFSSVQFSSVTQSCPTLCNPMNCSTPRLPVHHQLRSSR